MNSFGLGFTIEGFKIMTQSKKNNKMKKKNSINRLAKPRSLKANVKIFCCGCQGTQTAVAAAESQCKHCAHLHQMQN